jgi:hypothetical protein
MAEECFQWARDAKAKEVRVSLRQLAQVWLDAASKLDGLPPTRPAREEPNKSGPEDNNVVEQKVSYTPRHGFFADGSQFDLRIVASPLAVRPARAPHIFAITRSLYSHGEYRHCAPSSMPLLTVSGPGEGTGASASAGGADGAGTAARGGGRGECTGSTALSLQQCSRI